MLLGTVVVEQIGMAGRPGACEERISHRVSDAKHPDVLRPGVAAVGVAAPLERLSFLEVRQY
jgi:hypothetical protein